jgi:hypothetical protein
MKKILILTAGFGDGHNAAARSLRDAIELLDEDARAEVLDLFADSYGAFNTLARKTYLGIVQYAPETLGRHLFAAGKSVRRKTTRRFHAPAKHAGKNPGRNPARLRRLHLSGLCATSSKRFTRTTTNARSVHHRRHRFHHRQLRVVPRAERLFLRGQRRHRRSFAQGRRAGETNQDARLSGQPGFCRIRRPNCPAVGREPRRVLYIINTGKKKAGKAIDRCSNWTTSISPSPPGATPICAPN